jgi:hypothetical protein
LNKLRLNLRIRRSANVRSMTANKPWDRILRIKNIHLFTFSMIGVVFSVFMSYFKWLERCVPDEDGNCRPGNAGVDTTDATYVAATVLNTYQYQFNVYITLIGLQSVVLLTTAVSLVLIYQYYDLVLKEKRWEWSGLEELDLIEASGKEAQRLREAFRRSYEFWNSSLRWVELLEMAIHAFVPILWMEDVGWGSSLLEVSECFIFIRFYLVFRLLYLGSNIYIFRTDIVRSNKELQRSGYRITPFTTFKIIFYAYPAAVISITTAALTLIFGFCIFVVERSANPGLSNLWNCYWFVFVTLSTIGYGDYVPVTTTGRVLVIIMSIVMLFVMVLFGGVVVNLLSPTREQKYIQRYLEQRDADKRYKAAAVHMIETVFLEKKKRIASQTKLRSFQLRRSPLVYDAVRRLRAARMAIRQSLGAATDTVADEKLREIIIFANQLNKNLQEQGAAILFFQSRIAKCSSIVKLRMAAGSDAHLIAKVRLDVPPKDPATKAYKYSKFIASH